MTFTRRRCAQLAMAGTCISLATSVVPGTWPSTAASTDIGNTCYGKFQASSQLVVMTANAGSNPLPITPGSRGVVTRATFHAPALDGLTLMTTLKSMRGTGVPHEYEVAFQSAPLPVADGAHSFDVRVPIAPGDRLGIWGRPRTLVCQTDDPADVIEYLDRDLQPGQAATFAPLMNVAIPVVASVEPDVDGDGYGDDTQDECVRSAALQTACPVIALDSSASTQRRSILVVVSADNPARVRVSGLAKINGKKVRLEGGTRKVKPGTLGRFTVRHSKAMKAALAALPPGRSIKVRLTAKTTDALGEVTTDTCSVRVPSSRGGGS